LRNSGRSWNLSTADFIGAVRILWSKPESSGFLLPPLLLSSQKPALTQNFNYTLSAKSSFKGRAKTFTQLKQLKGE